MHRWLDRELIGIKHRDLDSAQTQFLMAGKISRCEDLKFEVQANALIPSFIPFPLYGLIVMRYQAVNLSLRFAVLKW